MATECTPPKVQFVPYIPMLKENNIRTGFLETEARIRLENACSRVGLWMAAVFEVGCTYGWRYGSLLKMRVGESWSRSAAAMKPLVEWFHSLKSMYSWKRVSNPRSGVCGESW